MLNQDTWASGWERVIAIEATENGINRMKTRDASSTCWLVCSCHSTGVPLASIYSAPASCPWTVLPVNAGLPFGADRYWVGTTGFKTDANRKCHVKKQINFKHLLPLRGYSNERCCCISRSIRRELTNVQRPLHISFFTFSPWFFFCCCCFRWCFIRHRLSAIVVFFSRRLIVRLTALGNKSHDRSARTNLLFLTTIYCSQRCGSLWGRNQVHSVVMTILNSYHFSIISALSKYDNI